MELSDSVEFRMLADSAGVSAEKMLAAFADPLHLFEHLTLEDLNKLQESCDRFLVVQQEIGNALARFSSFAEGFLAGSKG